MNQASEPFGLYIHWPFCVSKCPYCDFNSHVRAQIDEPQWTQAYLKEIDFWGLEMKGRQLTSVFFGGGTPSLMNPRTVGTILDSLPRYWTLAPDIEITLEANPNSVELNKFKAFKKAGINRLSLGIQSLEESSLKFLGRAHGRAEALEAIHMARQTFDRFSFDLIYARPSQTLIEWERELREAVTYGGSHMSLYQLTLEKGTAFYTQAQAGRLHLPEENLAADFYHVTQNIMTAAGLPAYEISNHARPGQESRHNQIYWRSHDYGAIGPGAHGRWCFEGKRWGSKNLRTPERWLESIEHKGHGQEEKIEITPDEHIDEFMMMGLRLHEGILCKRLEKIVNKPFEAIFNPQKLLSLLEDYYLIQEGDSLKATPQGLMCLNSVLSHLLI